MVLREPFDDFKVLIRVVVPYFYEITWLEGEFSDVVGGDEESFSDSRTRPKCPGTVREGLGGPKTVPCLPCEVTSPVAWWTFPYPPHFPLVVSYHFRGPYR